MLTRSIELIQVKRKLYAQLDDKGGVLSAP